jgi:hypothetical protein
VPEQGETEAPPLMQPLPAGGLLGFLRLNAVQEEGAELREIGLRGNAIDGARQNSSPSQTGDLNFSVDSLNLSIYTEDKEVDMDRNGDESENAAGGKGTDDKRFGQ